MHRTLLKTKLHRACVTHAEVDYEGSCAIDSDLLDLAGILEYEQIHIYNVSTGARLVTYAIRAQAGSRMISVNGAAAHLATPGDRVIICAYASLSSQELSGFKPTLVYLNELNQVTNSRDHIPVQAA